MSSSWIRGVSKAEPTAFAGGSDVDSKRERGLWGSSQVSGLSDEKNGVDMI